VSLRARTTAGEPGKAKASLRIVDIQVRLGIV